MQIREQSIYCVHIAVEMAPIAKVSVFAVACCPFDAHSNDAQSNNAHAFSSICMCVYMCVCMCVHACVCVSMQ